VCHIKKLIKQHDYYTRAPCAGDNKRPQKGQVCHTTQYLKMSQVLRERAIGMLTAGMSTRTVVRELNVLYHKPPATSFLENLAVSPTIDRVWASGLLMSTL
jgi:hypothetical protein